MSRQLLLALPLISALAGSALAQSTTVVTILMPQVDQQTIHASVVSAGPTATAYLLECPPGADSLDCGIGTNFRVTEGPSTLEYHMTGGDDFTAHASCILDGKDATCTADLSGDETAHETAVLTGYKDYSVSVTVTAGMELLTGGGGSATGSASGTADTTKLSGTITSTTTGAETAEATGASSSSTGGVPRITQNAVLAGVAAIVGGAAML